MSKRKQPANKSAPRKLRKGEKGQSAAKPGGPSDLRRRAEERWTDRKSRVPSRMSVNQARRLIHELEVCQIELEMQNEELVTSRRAAEEAQARYSDLFDFAPIGYVALDDGGILRAVNHAGARLLGRVRKALIGRPFSSLLKMSTDAMSMLLDQARQTEKTASREIHVGGGNETIVRITTAHVNQRGLTFLVALEDITEEKRQAEVARGAHELREADARKDEFLAMLSHELRNPLTPIVSSLHLLDRQGLASPEQLKYLNVIRRQVEHLIRIVDDLLDVTRIKRGKIQLERVVIDLAALVGSHLDDHRALFEERGIHLEGRFEPGPFWVDADPTRVAQVLTNLLGNARKFTPRGGQVELALRRAGSQLMLSVRDSGAGIPPELLPHIFEPFRQAPQTLDRSSGGLGLGLSTVKGLVELHGGSITIESPGSGHGTRVTLWLPLVAAPQAAVDGGKENASLPRRILVIEDNRDIAEGLQAMLAGRGHEVRAAHDGRAGLELIRDFQPELVICDIGLPGMDGYQVARAVRANRALRGTYLLSLSGYARPEDVELARKAGFDRHLSKPPDLDLLLRIIAETFKDRETAPRPDRATRRAR
jgi:PAS domain S-box-containing protein